MKLSQPIAYQHYRYGFDSCRMPVCTEAGERLQIPEVGGASKTCEGHPAYRGGREASLDDPQSKFPSEHSKLERTWLRSGIVSAGNSAVE
ncbi:MAG: hypothetical protein WAK48_33490 [Candidatus Acidiferrum sp.]|jgi:hypothetical protein